MAAFHGAVADRVGGTETRDDLTGGEDLDLKFVVGGSGDIFGESLGRAIDGVE